MSRYTKSKKIYLSFDTDTAGINATTKGGQTIRKVFASLGNIKQFDESHLSTTDDNYACEIRVVAAPEGKDPDEYVRAYGAEAYKNHVKNAPLLIDFEINNILKKKNNITTPQEKSRLTEELIPILCEIHNKIIQGEYIKMVSATLDISEEGLIAEVKKASKFSDDNTFTPILKTNVTKTSQIHELAQKNLLSVYLVDGSKIPLTKISEMVSTSLFTNELLIIVKSTIDKIINTVNNVRDLRDKLFTEFIENSEITKLLTELVYMADSFRGLSSEELKNAIVDIKTKICMLVSEDETKELKKKYSAANDDDIESLKLQIALRDKLKSRLNGDNS